jgi:hypothetical protein
VKQELNGLDLIFLVGQEKDKGRILNIKYLAENYRWHYKGESDEG